MNNIKYKILSRNSQTPVFLKVFFHAKLLSNAGAKRLMRYHNFAKCLVYLITVLLISTPSYAQNADAGNITTGLLGHWKLNETGSTTIAIDSAGGYHGTMQNGLSGNASGQGKISTSLNFDGSGDSIEIADNIFDDLTNFSACAWIYKTSTSGGFALILGKTSDGYDGWNLYVHRTSGRIGFYNTDQRYEVSAPGMIENYQWYHVCGVTNGGTSGDSIQLYLNEQIVSTAEQCYLACPDNNDAAHNLQIGTNASGGQRFIGYIDDVRIYNRALSADDVALLYRSYPGQVSCSASYEAVMWFNHDEKVMQYCNGTDWLSVGKALPTSLAPTNGLIGYWTLDEASGGTTALDTSGAPTANNGTWSGVGNIDSATGQIGTALDFEHNDSNHLNLGSDASLDNLGPLTISTWLNPESLVDYGFGNAGVIFGTTTNFGASGYTFYLLNNGGIRFFILTNSTGPQFDSNASYISTGAWSHVALTWDGNVPASAKIYVNGSEVAYATQVTGSGVFDDSSNDKGIGANPSHPVNTKFDGLMDDFRIYNRVLSASEIADIYNSGNGGSGSESCTSPTGKAGEMNYNLAEGVMQYCNGSNWINMGPKTAAAGTSANSLSPDAPTNGLVGHWTLDDTNTTALATVGINGTMINGLDGSTDNGLGKIGASIHFVDVPADRVIDFGNTYNIGTNDLSYSLWVSPETCTGAQIGIVSNREEIAGGDGYSLRYDCTTGILKAAFGGAAGTTYFADSTTDIRGNSWHHVVVNYDRDGNMELFLNGASNVTTDISAENAYNVTEAQNLTLGGSTYGGTSEFDGYIDDFRIYNRTLTQAEIEELYRYGSLVGHWTLDETSGTTAADSSVNGNDGTLNGTDFDTDSVGGKNAGGLYLDSSATKTLTISGSANYDAGVSDSRSYSLWFKTPSNNIALMEDFAGQQRTRFFITSTGAMQFYMRDNPLSGTSNASYGTNNQFDDDNWHHVTFVIDGSAQEAFFYADGVALGSQDYSALTGSVGFDGTITIPPTDAIIDDIRIYNRALSASEVAELYATTGGGAAPVTGCPNIGDVCDDGTVYAGVSPDGDLPMYAVPSDAVGGAVYSWNDGSTTYLDTLLDDCGSFPSNSIGCITGEINTNIIVESSATNEAANTCYILSVHDHDDWYLPSQNELELLYNAKTTGAFNGTFSTSGSSRHYWSSSERSNSLARFSDFSSGSFIVNNSPKDTNRSVRCVRKGLVKIGGTCSNPRGLAGEIVYNDSFNVMQFCNGSEWIGMN